jgi:site-specific recombinase XerD
MPDSSDTPTELVPQADGADVPADRELRELMESAHDRKKRAKKNTDRIYRRGWEHFTAFCEEKGFRPLPARPEAVGFFVERMATNGYALSTINTRLAAIKKKHVQAGEPSPTDNPDVKEHWEEVQKTTDREPSQKEPVLIEHLQRMEFDTSELSELRDRAVMFLGFALSRRRSELVSLEMRDVREVEGGIVYRIRNPKGKSDTETVQVPDNVPALNPTPNDALREWIGAAEIESGPLFRMVDRWGNVRDGALSGQSVYEIVRDRMESIEEDPEPYGAHSLRAGFATQAYMDDIGEHEAAAQTGHSKLETLRMYQRVNVVMEDHPLTRMGTPAE